MLYLFIRWVILAIAIGFTVYLMPGMHFTGNLIGLFILALVFALVNAIVRPIISFLTCPLILLTLGLFVLVINALMLMLTAWLTPMLTIDGFWTAFWASIIIGAISWVLNLFVHDSSRW